jgi:hypothetical protein
VRNNIRAGYKGPKRATALQGTLQTLSNYDENESHAWSDGVFAFSKKIAPVARPRGRHLVIAHNSNFSWCFFALAVVVAVALALESCFLHAYTACFVQDWEDRRGCWFEETNKPHDSFDDVTRDSFRNGQKQCFGSDDEHVANATSFRPSKEEAFLFLLTLLYSSLSSKATSRQSQEEPERDEILKALAKRTEHLDRAKRILSSIVPNSAPTPDYLKMNKATTGIPERRSMSHLLLFFVLLLSGGSEFRPGAVIADAPFLRHRSQRPRRRRKAAGATVSTSRASTTRTILGPVTEAFERVNKLSTSDSDSIHFEPLLDACRVFLSMLHSTGPSAVAMDFSNNLRKAEKLLQYHRKGSCMKTLLQHERDDGVHHHDVSAENHAPRLRDPSGAMGLLWIRRTLFFQSDWYECMVKGQNPKEAALQAYSRQLEPYHGWALRKFYRTFLKSQLPTKQHAVLSKFLVGSVDGNEEKALDKVVLDDLRRLVDVLRPLLRQKEQTFVELDLEDTRAV